MSDKPKSSQAQVTYTKDDGGKITITINGDDFVLEASRAKAKPLVDQAVEYIGASASAVWSHPTDVTIPFFWATALSGVFNSVAPQAQKNAQEILKIAYEGVWQLTNADNLRLSLQMFILYQQSELRGKFLVKTGSRMFVGSKVSSKVFSLGRKTRKAKTGNKRKAAGLFALASIGAIFRVARDVHNLQLGDSGLSPYPYINAILTGDSTIFSLEREIGVETWTRLRRYLVENPDAIKIDDAELKIVKTAVNAFFDFVSDPKGTVNKLAE